MQNKATRKNPLFDRYARLRSLGAQAPAFSVALDLGGGDDDLFLRLPFRRNWIFILISAACLIGFSLPLAGVFNAFSGSRDGGLFDLVSMLFMLFWGLGWSVAVAILALVFLLIVAGRETLRVKGGQLVLRLGVPGIGFGAIYPGALIRNFRARQGDADTGSSWRGPHLAFDFAGETVGFGSAIAAEQADRLIGQLQQLFPEHDQAIAELPPLAADTDASSLSALTAGANEDVKSSARPHSLTSASSLALIVSNLIPLGGVLFGGWSIGEIMLLFWAESAVIGFYNLCKLGKLGGWSVLFYGPFFVGHYGAFMVGHLLFIYGFFGDGFGSGTDVQVTQVLQDFLQLAPVLLAFFISHGISFFTNFLGRQEYRGKDIKQQMSQPYRRIIIMHVTIIFGGFMAMAFDTVLPALLLLIVLKLVMDLHAHLAEHGKLT
jgi:hypothetical protein